jgi:hypothetical protein
MKRASPPELRNTPYPYHVSTLTASTDDTLELIFCSTMKVVFTAVSLFFAASFVQTAAGLQCSSGCSACWLDNDKTGVDTKLLCNNVTLECDSCPAGYHGQHCAQYRRCT